MRRFMDALALVVIAPLIAEILPGLLRLRSPGCSLSSCSSIALLRTIVAIIRFTHPASLTVPYY